MQLGLDRWPAIPNIPETTGAERSGWVDNVVANFGMGHVCAAVKLSIYYDPAPDACAHRHIDNSRLTFSSAPAGLPEGGGIRVVFQGRGHAELPRQKTTRMPPPSGRPAGALEK